MKNTEAAPHKRQVQFTQNQSKNQRKKIYVELFRKPQNTKMLHVATGIPRESICRRKRDLEDEGLLRVVKKDYCPITGELVQFLSTNPQEWAKWELIRKNNQS